MYRPAWTTATQSSLWHRRPLPTGYECWTSPHVSSVVAVVCCDFCTPSFIGSTIHSESSTSSVCFSTDANRIKPLGSWQFPASRFVSVCVSNQLVVPRYQLSTYGRRVFSVDDLELDRPTRHWTRRERFQTIIDWRRFYFYRALHFSTKRGLAIACRLSVCPSVTLVDIIVMT